VNNMKANLLTLPTGIPKGFVLVHPEVQKHPSDEQWGILLKHTETDIYVLHCAGVNRSVPYKWAISIEKN